MDKNKAERSKADKETSFVVLDSIKDSTVSELYERAQDMYARGLITAHDVRDFYRAVVYVNRIFIKQDNPRFFIRQATLEDVDALMDMVSYWAAHGQNLPRKRNEIVRDIQTYAVCIKDAQVVGCACLYVYDSGLAEIRSLGVSPTVQRQGQGRAIVECLLKRARRMFINRVFVLTRSPEFFARVGFTLTTKEALPEKILKDCDNCPKRENCDEIAYICNLDQIPVRTE